MLFVRKERENCKVFLEGKTVCLSLDGWSNIHNEPIICVVVHTKDGDAFLVHTVDTSGNPHTSDYLVTFAIIECEGSFGCQVRSVVTDIAANVAKMRSELEKARHNHLWLFCTSP